MRRKPPDGKIDRLRGTELLRGATEAQLLAGQLADETTRPAGTVLACEGRHPREVLLVVDGTAARYRHGRRVAADGPLIGQEAHVTGRPYDHTVIAETEVRLLVTDPRHYGVLLEAIPRLQRRAISVPAPVPTPVPIRVRA